MSNTLLNAQVLVIGGSSGIGLATAVAAAEVGTSVTIASRSKVKLDMALRDIRGSRRAVVLDTCDQSALERFFMTEEPWDHVVVTAAQTPTGSVRTLDLADAHAALESKFCGAYRVSRAAKIKAGGSLTFISGFLSVRPSGDSVLQGAINAALEGTGLRLGIGIGARARQRRLARANRHPSRVQYGRGEARSNVR